MSYELEGTIKLIKEWRPVVGYEDFYHVSNMGEVKSLRRTILRSNNTTQCFKERNLHPALNEFGYRIVNLHKDRIARPKRVHRLVAEAFLPEYSNSLFVDHKDGDRQNNALPNLRMVTNGENMRGYRSPRKGASSGFRGVCWHTGAMKWVAYISHNCKRVHLGTFKKEINAARAFDQKAIELGFYPEALNFPNN